MKPISVSKIEVQEDNIIEKSGGLENNKGVFKIEHSENSQNKSYNLYSSSGIRPLGIRFKFNSDVL